MTDVSDLVVVKRDGGAAFPFEGTMTFLRPGLIAHKDHPIVRGREVHFEPLTVHFDVDPPKTKAAETKQEPQKSEPEQDERVVEETAPEKTASAGTVKSAAARTQGARAR